MSTSGMRFFDLAECRSLLGGLYKDGTHLQPAAPDVSAARAEYVTAQETLEGLVRDFPDNVRYKQALARTQERL